LSEGDIIKFGRVNFRLREVNSKKIYDNERRLVSQNSNMVNMTDMGLIENSASVLPPKF